MDDSLRKPVIGILGGIYSGKSTVSAEFARFGCAVIDADKIAHEMLDEPAVKEEILACLGKAVLDSAGKIDRTRLARIAFADGDKLADLNRILHPPVLARAERLIQRYKKQPPVRAIVLDMPLLVEVGWAERCDKLIFVDCKRAIRAERAKKIGTFDENELKVRENFQISLDKKARLSDNKVDNNSGLAALARQVADIFTNIVNNG